jgi:uncharacterized damage-inducible protein DinB
MKNVMEAPTANQTIVLTSEQLFANWQGHRSLTRKVIEAFPEDKLFTHSVGGMRPFAELAMEMIAMATPGIRGVVTGEWTPFKEDNPPTTKQQLLELWDRTTAELNELWPQIPGHRFQEVDVAFGQWKNANVDTIFYFIDNEIHHRGQGYVYLRSLGITPPPFWER